MKKIVAVFTTLLLVCLMACPVWAGGFAVPESVETTAAALYFVNLDTGIPVVEQNIHERRSIASLTKLMTTLLLLENVPDLDGTMITAPTSVYVPPVTNASSSTADIRPGETVSARTLLYAMLLPSGNEAAAITAYHLGGGNMANFYAMMNARAAELGCTDTNFTNPHGLAGIDDGNYSSAYDLFLIAKACWQNEVFRTAAASGSYDMPFTNYHKTPENAQKPDAAYTIYTTVKMQVESAGVYRSYIRGMKTGSMPDAGRNYVSAAVNDKGESFIGVVLGCPWDPAPDGYAYSFHDTANVYDWIFANFSVQPTLRVDSPAAEVPVKLSSQTDVVKLMPATELQSFLPNEGGEAMLEKQMEIPKSVNAPVKRGDVIGKMTLKLSGEVIGTVELVAAEDVKLNPLLSALNMLGLFFKSTYFRVVLVLTALFLIGYYSLMFWLRAQQRKRKAAARRRMMGTQTPPAAQKGAARMPQHVRSTPQSKPPASGQRKPPRGPSA